MINQKTLQKIYDKAYPIGCYYFSNNSTNPGVLFGGTWTQIQDCFVKAATSSISQTGGSSQKTISNFVPSHSHTVSNTHTHSISSHSHSSVSISHSHSINTHSHSSTSRSHSHTLSWYTQSPPGTGAHSDNSYRYAYAYSGLITYVTFYTASTGGGTSGAAAGSTSTDGNYLGSIQRNSSSLNSASASTNSSGSSSGCTINILPPYRECYCWRRTR